MDDRWLEGTWVGFEDKSSEHIVVVANGGPALRVRTVKARPDSERWSSKAISNIKATVTTPNPKDDEQDAPMPERETMGMEGEVEPSGAELPEAPVQQRETRRREFKIGDRLLDKYKFTEGCEGCEAKKAGRAGKPHSSVCRQRIEERMRQDGSEERVLEERNRRIVGESRVAEEVVREERSEDASAPVEEEVMVEESPMQEDEAG